MSSPVHGPQATERSPRYDPTTQGSHSTHPLERLGGSGPPSSSQNSSDWPCWSYGSRCPSDSR